MESGLAGSGSLALLFFVVGTSAPVGPIKAGSAGGAEFAGITVALIFASAAFSLPVKLTGGGGSVAEFDFGAATGEADF